MFFQDKWAILFGAGVSFNPPACVPLGSHITYSLLKNSLHDEFISNISEFMNYDTNALKSGKILRFEKLCEIIYESSDSLSFLNFFDKYRTPNSNHYSLAKLSNIGYILATTNFDNLLEIAAMESGINIDQLITGQFGEVIEEKKLYKLHGTISKFPFDGGDTGEIHATIKNITNKNSTKSIFDFIHCLCEEYNILVVGYSGLDDFDVSPALLTATSTKKIVWVEHNEKMNEDFSFLTYSDFHGINNSTYKYLLESCVLQGSRSKKDVCILRCKTDKLLSKISNVQPYNRTEDCAPYKFQDVLDNWFSENLTDVDKAVITTKILIHFQQGKSYSFLYNFFLSKNGFLGSDFDKVIATLSSTLLLIDKNLVENASSWICKMLGQVSSTHFKSIVCCNVAIAHSKIGNNEKATKYIDKAVSLLGKDTKNTNYLKFKFNKCCVSNDEDTVHILQKEILPIAEENNRIDLLPSIYFSLNQINEQYMIKAAKAAVLASNLSLFVRAIINLSIQTLPIFKDFLFQLLKDGGEEDSFISIANDDEVLTLFYGVTAELLGYENPHLGLTLARKGEQALLRSPEYSLNLHAYFSLTVTLQLDLMSRYDLILEYYQTYFWELEDITDIDAKCSIIADMCTSSFKYADTKNFEIFLNKLLYEISVAKDFDLYEHIIYVYYYTGRHQEAIELGKKVLPRCNKKQSYIKINQYIGHSYYRCGMHNEAKRHYLSALLDKEQSMFDCSLVYYKLARILYSEGKYISSALLFCLSELIGSHFKVTCSTYRSFKEQIEVVSIYESIRYRLNSLCSQANLISKTIEDILTHLDDESYVVHRLESCRTPIPGRMLPAK